MQGEASRPSGRVQEVSTRHFLVVWLVQRLQCRWLLRWLVGTCSSKSVLSLCWPLLLLFCFSQLVTLYTRFFPYSPIPRIGGTADAEIKDPSVKDTIAHSRSLFFPPQIFSRVFPVLAVANAGGPSVGPQNKIGHPAPCHRQLMCWVPTEYK